MSKSVKKFNALHGVVATRVQLEKLSDLAIKEEQIHIFNKIQDVLLYNEEDFFEINIKEQAFEIVPKSMLNGLHFEETEEEFTGLNKAVTPSDIYQMITDRMLKMIKEASGNGYKKKWSAKSYGKGYTIPFNFESKKRYRGVNVFLLTNFKPLENPYFMTFKQIEANKGKLKKGSSGYPVVYFTKLYKIEDAEKNIDFGTYNFDKAKQFADDNGINYDLIKDLPILKYYNVFNGKDIEGIDFDLKNFKIGYIENELPPVEKLTIPEAIIANYPKKAPVLRHGGDRAFYRPFDDLVQMPFLADFDTAQDYYRTLLHEYSHSTGNVERLNRDFTGRFGSKKYAFEELVAEWGATFLSAEAGIIWHTDKNHAEYIKNWNGALTFIKEDTKFIMKACTKAQELTDFILQFDENGNPKYLKDLQAIEPKIDIIKPNSNGQKKTNKITVKSKKKNKTPLKSTVIASSNGQKMAKLVKEPAVKKVRKRKAADKSKQIALFDPKEKLAGVPIIEEAKEPKKPLIVNPNIKPISSTGATPSEFFTVNGEVGKFLQAVERKPFHSVVITMDGMQGAGKTTTLYKFIDAFASAGNECLFISGEEHPDSSLAIEKRDKYLSNEALQHTSIVGSVKDVQQLYEFIEPFDIIFIDSWQKLLRMVGALRLDEDLRQKFNGKVFVVIFQQTTTGRTKGGAEVVFDGDIITKMVKEERFEDNYAYFDKNRYTKVPIETIRYNIATGTTYNPLQNEDPEDLENNTEEIPNILPVDFSFQVN
ncbi:zincin-like metallopeptidase domain-containing protein [Flavobacterium sp. J27]|uniref:zincin-like metallopeptidase domain-containing protein n=1 Tax=Flavobacterium sp. J27 TaxID=2060419 RepID=UPI001031D3B9|nr:zincin-like metallopeptidase domain-containing protein [Flavobacterium sp. J27]